jgi:hypothetical protein
MSDYNKYLFRCDICNYETIDESNFKRHKKSTNHKRKTGHIKKKSKRIYKCSFCDYRTGSYNVSLNHYRNHLKKEFLHPPKFYKNPEQLLKKINEVIDFYDNKKLNADDFFNFNYYYQNYHSLCHSEKNDLLFELISSYNYLILMGHPPSKSGSRKKIRKQFFEEKEIILIEE